ncbi:MAG: NYN domain-containing protein [Gammaproteobacteria bacterium]|nr:NYN domain-containing protein [Gammaproteobacteria bacterium]
MDRVKAALFIDFDNVFLSLKKDYSDAVAKRFANPSRWLPWLEGGEHANGKDTFRGERSLLIRRCYGSPDLMRPFRAYFTRLGFQVVDCPPLTKSGKNSADIVMTLDIADTIEHTTRFDEFLILSSDADFTPVALRLRAHDRITSILANQQTAAAFRSCCDIVIDMDEFEAVFGETREQAPSPVPPRAGDASGDFGQLRIEVETEIRRELAESSAALRLPELASRMRERWPVVGESDWLGAGGFKKLLLTFEDRHLRFSSVPPGFVYDPARHAAPPDSGDARTEHAIDLAPPNFADVPDAIADLVERLNKVVGLPRLGPDQYQVVFEALAGQSGRQSTLGDITKNARDHAIEAGAAVGRQPFAFVTRALHLVGLAISETRTAPGEIARLFRTSVEQQALDAQLEMEADDLRLLDELLGVGDGV